MHVSEEVYIPEEDIVQTLPDGRTVLLAPKGVPVPMAVARQRGFIKVAQLAAPAEIKAAPAEVPEGETAPEQPEQQAEASDGTKSRTTKRS
jgi:hypothetical protein